MTTPDQPTLEASLPPETTEDMAHLALGSGRYGNPFDAVTAIRIAMARFESKLDQALQDGRDFAEFEEEMVKDMHALDKRLVKLEGWQGTLMWVAGTAVTLGGAAIGAVITYFLSGGGA